MKSYQKKWIVKCMAWLIFLLRTNYIVFFPFFFVGQIVHSIQTKHSVRLTGSICRRGWKEQENVWANAEGGLVGANKLSTQGGRGQKKERQQQVWKLNSSRVNPCMLMPVEMKREDHDIIWPSTTIYNWNLYNSHSKPKYKYTQKKITLLLE